MAIPDTNNFSLQDIITEINPSSNDLIQCFDDSNVEGFDPDYIPSSFDPYAADKSGYELYYFRNYHHERWHNYELIDTVNLPISNCKGIFFKPDGSIMYILYSTGGGLWYLQEYNLSNAWDITSYGAGGYSNDLLTHNATGVAFKNDGTKCYITSQTGTDGLAEDKILQYDLSDAWNPFTMSHEYSLDIEDVASNLSDIRFSGMGNRMFLSDWGYDNIFEYKLNTPWDLSDGYSSYSFFDVGSITDYPTGIAWGGSGYYLYILDWEHDKIEYYETSIPWSFDDEIDYKGTIKNLSGLNYKGESLYMHPQGDYLYMLDFDGIVYVYEAT